MTILCMDLEVASISYTGNKFILVVIDEVTSFMVTILIHQPRSEEIGDALIKHIFTKYSMPGYMIMDQIIALCPITYSRNVGFK